MTDLVHIEELKGQPSVMDVLHTVRNEEFILLLDSATSPRARDSRYTFLTADPIDVCVLPECCFGDDPFSTTRTWQSRMEAVPDRELPPFHGGIAGLMSYDLGRAFERLPEVGRTQFSTPVLAAGLFDWAIVWDHLASKVTLYVIRIDAQHESTSAARQKERVQWVGERLRGLGGQAGATKPGHTALTGCGDSANKRCSDPVSMNHVQSVPVESTFSQSEYLEAVQRVIEYIAAGDIFQANLSQRLTAPWGGSAIDLYRHVRSQNAAPFCGLLQTSEFAIVSASPERFLKVEQGRRVETRPMKGTRRRQQSPIADLYIADELLASEKDRAENVMIVDLLRNDISRVCSTGSVEVTGVCEIEVFETVQHLVSTVVGELRQECDVWDLCAACFPGGSITGAPKIRAMEIIAELEQTSRGAYCGSLFYCGPDNAFDSSILIRTFTLRNGQVAFPVGGGVVADSVPRDEFDETLHKASGMLRSLRQ